MKRFFSLIFTAACLLAVVPGVACAAVPGTASLTVRMEYNGAPLSGLRVAVCPVAFLREANGAAVFDPAQAFSGAGADFSSLTKEKNIALAAALNTYAAANGVGRSVKATDSGGSAVFTGLSAGLYLVAQASGENSEYVFAPYLIAVPAKNEQTGEWDYNVAAYPKTEPARPGDKPASVSVYKVWAGTGSPPAGGIQVQLYRSGAPYGSRVTLSAKNHWSYTWDNLDAKDTWTADEPDVPEGYVKTIAGSASTGFVITNTRRPKEVPPNPDRPKTGDENRPALWLSLMGASFVGFVTVVIFLVRRRRRREKTIS